MELVLLCGLLVMAGVTPTQGSILNVNKMIKQVTGKIPFNYWAYGCHCGFGGRGEPKDATDRCCLEHDCCYSLLKTQRCKPQTNHYKYNFSLGDIQCSDKGSWCEKQLCACDKAMAFCLKSSLNTYQKKLRFYLRPKCKGTTPPCTGAANLTLTLPGLPP
ncbi:group IID secretory phospholipase A2 [Cavia porcellus]|uniref:Phospholipase A2 n=1 Tax=Cavia porcellus TaxID=10141 RepID=H0VDB8_CAVPO|nr:group IID secretory phospholipase A2 [Cavia porcellus]XP_013009678.1 group IID secretory phospholipase A2 [Cavia porcellus]XP_013009679.1 group IID secretory phospholipase A2 [Cavia porcellus]XP_013009680.1 group IID secretory phospholipase A2 [Cavia porcellus]XP_013009681.1 group IID secretory phospholipase A2 [Cavia porcellus]XP_013009682.1 group IID secretory phospholipase A2 [Cavia porcellus]